MTAPFTDAERRKFERIRDLTLKVIRTMDNEKMLNYQRYVDFFKACEANPDVFRKWDVLQRDELDSAPNILQLPFEEVRMNAIKKAADELGISLEDYIYYRHNDKRGVRTKMKVPVGYVHIKRVQQILSKKNHYVSDIEDRSLKTGDVKAESKVAGISEPEAYALLAVNATKTLEELFGPRADNIEKKRQMYRQIARDGFCTLENLKSTHSSSTTLNTINTYLLASGIRSDLITNTMKTEYTINSTLNSHDY